jgi:predicted RNA-binding protein with PIN domain
VTFRLIVDGNNVMGAAADGWWRDRPAAARRLLGRVQRYAAATGASVVLVFDVPDPELTEGDHGGVELRYAARTGRDAGDDRIRELLASDDRAPNVEVVTSDRALAASARALGASVAGAGTFLARLRDLDC